MAKLGQGKAEMTVQVTDTLMQAAHLEAKLRGCDVDEVVDIALHAYFAIREITRVVQSSGRSATKKTLDVLAGRWGSRFCGQAWHCALRDNAVGRRQPTYRPAPKKERT